MFWGSIRIYCGSYGACKRFSATNIGGNIISVGTYVMYQATIVNVNGTVLAYGKYALYLSRVENVGNVCMFVCLFFLAINIRSLRIDKFDIV